jgi:hypothetical protein
MLERMCASPGMARATFEAGFRTDVRPILPAITVPTLVLHARDDPAVPVQSGRYLADHIAGARMVELDGADHAPWFTDPDRIATEIEELLTGSHAACARPRAAAEQLELVCSIGPSLKGANRAASAALHESRGGFRRYREGTLVFAEAPS